MRRILIRTVVVLALVLCFAIAANAEGKIKMSLPGDSKMALQAENGAVKSITSKNGVFILPAGKYRVTGYSSAVKTKAGESWSMFATNMKPVSVIVTDGKTSVVKLGEPFVASVKVSSQSLPNISMDLKTVGAGAEAITIYGPKPPGFKGTGKTGGAAWSGSFKYG